jgi:hypothetical protein
VGVSRASRELAAVHDLKVVGIVPDLETAKTSGITVPPTLLALADEVIQ